MKYKKQAFSVIFIMIFFLVSGLSFADDERDKHKRKYKITITNLTRGQIFSPPIVIAHNRSFRLFTEGDEASPELAALAEGGATGLLEAQIDGLYPFDIVDGMILPGESKSVTLKISKRGRLKFFTVAGMLVTTNDAFLAARDIWFLGRDKVIVNAVAYDAGSEQNSENCDYIPGPPCGSGAHDPAKPEGYVHVHAGVHGIDPDGEESSLNPAEHDWRNPVAKITIRRIHH